MPQVMDTQAPPAHVDAITFTRFTNNLSLHGSINNNPFLFLVDTGASNTVISYKVYKDILNHSLLDPHNGNLFSVNGQNIKVHGKLIVPFTINNKLYPFQAFVAEGVTYDVIIGTDFLNHFNAVIDLHNRSLSFQNETHTEPFGNVANTCKAQADRTYILPPHSESIVLAYLSFPFDPGSTGLIEPIESLSSRYNVSCAASLVCVSNKGAIPIKLLNPTTANVTIYQHTTCNAHTSRTLLSSPRSKPIMLPYLSFPFDPGI